MSDPPENRHLNVQKLPEKFNFFLKNIQKIQF